MWENKWNTKKDFCFHEVEQPEQPEPVQLSTPWPGAPDPRATLDFPPYKRVWGGAGEGRGAGGSKDTTSTLHVS
jgi:hypothetical protein